MEVDTAAEDAFDAEAANDADLLTVLTEDTVAYKSSWAAQ